MEYDAAGRLTLLERTSDGLDVKAFQYDPSTGRLSATARYNHLPVLGTIAVTEGLQYHPLHGRLVRRDVAIGSAPPFSGGRSYAATREFDDLGEVSSTGYPFRTNADGTPAETPRYVSYTHRNGRLTGVTGWATLQYQPNGALAKVTHNGNVTETWTADPNGMARPGDITVARGATTHWTSGSYDFDGAGNIKSIGSLTYTYDRFGRLSHWQSGTAAIFSAEGIVYDAFGNRVGTTLNGCTGPFRCYTTAVTSRAVTGTTNHFADSTYDAAGNVVADAGRTFTYDAVNMTTAITAGGRTFRYLYTADDERVAAVESLANGGYKTTWTLRGLGNELLTVLDGDTWKEDRIWRGATVAGFNTPAGKRHQSVDHLGSPRVITDDAGNMVGGIQQFTPFGNGGALDAGALQFTGHERDRATLAGGTTALPDYMHARYYDVEGGRFLSVDPTWASADLGKPQSWNRYSYVLNNPINYTDPDGRCPLVLDCVALGALGKAVFVVGTTLVVGAVSETEVNGKPIGTHVSEFILRGGGSSGEMAAETMVNNFQRQQAAKLDQSPMQSSERNPKQDKILTNGDIDKLQNAGHDVHELKGGDNASKYDLYKDKQGNVYVKPKGGKGPGEETGINLNDLEEEQ